MRFPQALEAPGLVTKNVATDNVLARLRCVIVAGKLCPDSAISLGLPDIATATVACEVFQFAAMPFRSLIVGPNHLRIEYVRHCWLFQPQRRSVRGR